MQKVSVLVMGAFLFGLGVANAQEGNQDCRPAKLTCRYMASSTGKKSGTGQCTAVAHLAHYNHAAANSERHNKLVVDCNGIPFDGHFARHSSNNGYEFVTGGVHSDAPVVKYPSMHTLDSQTFPVSSWMNTPMGLYEGICHVQILLETEASATPDTEQRAE